jgi:hypothetical protein
MVQGVVQVDQQPRYGVIEPPSRCDTGELEWGLSVPDRPVSVVHVAAYDDVVHDIEDVDLRYVSHSWYTSLL